MLKILLPFPCQEIWPTLQKIFNIYRWEWKLEKSVCSIICHVSYAQLLILSTHASIFSTWRESYTYLPICTLILLSNLVHKLDTYSYRESNGTNFSQVKLFHFLVLLLIQIPAIGEGMCSDMMVSKRIVRNIQFTISSIAFFGILRSVYFKNKSTNDSCLTLYT